MGYNFTTEWLKGSLNQVPDALSRNSTSNPEPHETLAESDLDHNQAPTTADIRIITTSPMDNLRFQSLRDITSDDQDYQTLKHYIINDLQTTINNYLSHADLIGAYTHLSVEDDLIVYG